MDMLNSINRLLKRKKNPKVSVILPVYNEEPFLRQCMDSLVNQTLKDIEIICVDDGSTDKSLSILREYKKIDKRIRIITGEHKNAGIARNKGIDVATGKYLYFPDSDDYCQLNLLEKAYEEAEDKEADVTIFKSYSLNNVSNAITQCAFSLYLDKLPSKRPFSIDDIEGNFFRFIMGWAWDKLFLRDYIDSLKIRFQEQRTTNDMYFVYMSLINARKITTYNNELYTQRVCVDTSLSMTRYISGNCFYYALLEIKKSLINNNKWEKYECIFVDYAMHCCVSNYQFIDDSKELIRIIYDLGIVDAPKSWFSSNEEFDKCQLIIKQQYNKNEK